MFNMICHNINTIYRKCLHDPSKHYIIRNDASKYFMICQNITGSVKILTFGIKCSEGTKWNSATLNLFIIRIDTSQPLFFIFTAEIRSRRSDWMIPWTVSPDDHQIYHFFSTFLLHLPVNDVYHWLYLMKWWLMILCELLLIKVLCCYYFCRNHMVICLMQNH